MWISKTIYSLAFSRRHRRRLFFSSFSSFSLCFFISSFFLPVGFFFVLYTFWCEAFSGSKWFEQTEHRWKYAWISLFIFSFVSFILTFFLVHATIWFSVRSMVSFSYIETSTLTKRFWMFSHSFSFFRFLYSFSFSFFGLAFWSMVVREHDRPNVHLLKASREYKCYAVEIFLIQRQPKNTREKNIFCWNTESVFATESDEKRMDVLLGFLFFLSFLFEFCLVSGRLS